MKIKKIIFYSYLILSIFLFTKILDSETLTVTTYYPAPYGGYTRLLTTDQTILAKDNGSVGIGTSNPWSGKLVVSRPGGSVASFEDGTGPCCSNYYTVSISEGGGRQPTLQFHDSGVAEGQIILSNGAPGIPAGRNFRFQSVQTSMNGWFTGSLRVDGDLSIGGRLNSMCTYRWYGDGVGPACAWNEILMGYIPASPASYTGFYAPRGTGDVLHQSWIYVAIPNYRGGWMTCCKFGTY